MRHDRQQAELSTALAANTDVGWKIEINQTALGPESALHLEICFRLDTSSRAREWIVSRYAAT